MLTKKEVEKIAELARLRMDENEKEKFTEDLSSIIGYVQKLSEIDIDVVPLRGISRREKKVEPMTGGTNLESVTRNDDETKCIADSEMREQILSAAPDREGDSFKVPSILE